MSDQTAEQDKFLDQARLTRRGIASELASFVWQNKKWWLLPIIAVLLALAALVALGGSGLAPLIYTVF